MPSIWSHRRHHGWIQLAHPDESALPARVDLLDPKQTRNLFTAGQGSAACIQGGYAPPSRDIERRVVARVVRVGCMQGRKHKHNQRRAASALRTMIVQDLSFEDATQ